MTDGILLAEIQPDRLLRAVRHADHRRGPRALPEHRLHPGLPQAAAASPSRPKTDHHLGDHRPRAVLPVLRRCTGDRGLRPHLPGGDPLPAASRRGCDDDDRRPDRDQIQAICDAVAELRSRGPRRHPGLPVRRAGDPRHRGMRCRRWTCATPRSCRCMPGCRRPSSTGSFSRTPDAPDRAGHQRRRDVADGARDPVRDRPGHGADLPLQPPH